MVDPARFAEIYQAVFEYNQLDEYDRSYYHDDFIEAYDAEEQDLFWDLYDHN